MGGFGIPLDMSTTLIGGIVIGLAVDDTIHFMHRFNRHYDQTGDPERAVRETLETTGTAMLFTSVVLTAGFLIFTLAYMRNIVSFGVLCAFRLHCRLSGGHHPGSRSDGSRNAPRGRRY